MAPSEEGAAECNEAGGEIGSSLSFSPSVSGSAADTSLVRGRLSGGGEAGLRNDKGCVQGSGVTIPHRFAEPPLHKGAFIALSVMAKP